MAAAASDASQATVAVAFSGGGDSLALLHATCHAAQALGVQVVALHIHHGLLAQADSWVQSAQRLCARWRRCGLPLRLRWGRLAGKPAPGDSLEAWARAGRYKLLARLAKEEGASLVLLAQHRRDQAETVLLQALRGGGPAGLAAMPLSAERQGLIWARPWLDQPHALIDAYLRRHHLRAVLDPSNLDARLARNRLRLHVWPALLAAFGDAETALAAAARRAQEASAALAELAALDLAALVDGQGRLAVAGWRGLSPARQANALRAWWAGQAGRGAPEALVQRLLAQVPAQGAARWPAGGLAVCVLHRGRLQHLAQWPGGPDTSLPTPGPAPSTSTSLSPSLSPSTSRSLDLSQPGRWAAPGWPGVWEVSVCTAGGAAPGCLQTLQARARSGGERFQASAGGLPQSLKKQYQQAGIPAHGRAGPLLWSAGRLLWVPGLGIDARCQAADGEPQLALRWCADAALPAPPAPVQAAG